MMHSDVLKRWIYTIICGILLFSLIFLRSWHLLGPISWRNFAAIILFTQAFIFCPKTHFNDNCINTYIVWLFVYIFVNIITGYIETEHVYKNLIGYHMVSLMLLFALPRIVTSPRQLRVIIIWFSIFYIINALTTIFQFLNNPIAWDLGNFISPMNAEKAERMESLASSSDTMLTYSICCGLNGFVVTNGQFIACFAPLATYLAMSSKLVDKVIATLVMICILVTSICVQQRMCFFITLLFSLVFLYYLFGSVQKMLPFLLIGFIGGFYVFDDINLEAFGRLFDLTDDHRMHTGEYLSMFLSSPEYVLFGHCTIDDIDNNEMFLTMGHNSLLDSLRRGGIICFLIYIYLGILILKKSYQIFKYSMKNRNIITVCLCTAVVLNLCYSLTHSDGIPSGSVFFWGAYALMMASYNIDRHNQMYANYVKPI